jgi:hypothetical protein
MVGREHRAEGAEYRVELAVGERQGLGVALDEVDGQALSTSPLAAALEQCRDVVAARHVTAEPRRGERGVATAGCHIEDPPSRVQVGRVD